MKSIRFKEILFLSYREKKARRINLNSDIIVIRGGNGSGKSCLLKSLYGVFGAFVNKYPEGWNPQHIIVLLKFTIDGINYKAMRIGKDFYLVNPDNTYFSETSDMERQAENLSKLFELDLYYYAEQSTKKRLPVGCFFMPFYIDQDSGWQQPWSSFIQVGNEQVKRNVMLYYTGVINYDYYLSQSRLLSLKSEYKKWYAEKTVQDNFIGIVKNKLKSKVFSLSEDAFKDELDEFVRRIQDLKEKQNKILKVLEDLYYNKMFKENRVSSLHSSIKEIEEDFKYALQNEDLLTCPVCGAHTDNSAIARLGMNIDIEECRELIVQYNIELSEIDKRIEREKAKSDELNKQIEEIQALVMTKKEEYTLKEYLDNKVVQKLHSLFTENEQEFEDNLERLKGEIADEDSKLKNLKGTNRLKEIMKLYRECLAKYSKELDGSFDSRKNHSFGEKIKGSGSSHPKETLAYFFTYLYIMQRYSTPIMLPVVIDEFKQNGTTDKTVNNMISFAINHRPKGGQVIYTISDENYEDGNSHLAFLDLDGNHLLIENDFKSVTEEIDGILNKNFILKG